MDNSILKMLRTKGYLVPMTLPFSFSRVPSFLSLLCVVLTLISSKVSSTPPFGHVCLNTSTYTPNSTYKSNINFLLSVLSSNASTAANGFYNFTAGPNSPDAVYGLFLCRGDVLPSTCGDCVTTASTDIVQDCPKEKWAIVYYNDCLLRYSNQTIFSVMDQTKPRAVSNTLNTTNIDPNRFREVLGEIMNDTAARAAAANDVGSSGKKFATKEANVSADQTLYGLAQCTPDISSDNCMRCLEDAISGLPDCCSNSQGGRYVYPSCNVRYELYKFYYTDGNVSVPPPPGPAGKGGRVLFPSCHVQYESYHFYDTPSPPTQSPLVLPPPPPPPPPPADPATSPGKKKHAGLALLVVIAIVVANAIAVTAWFLGRKAKKSNAPREDTFGNEITTVQSLQYDLITIQAATNNFSDDNKIGEGGFGKVYKGTLPNGQELAVKRLSQTSGQGIEEFENEVVLVAKIQHRNLVKLLGFCLEGGEKILVYEFVPNKSLDCFLSDPEKQVKLDWSRRYKIIEGIARGILYLHEDSQIKIIHRDLKASNILLDGDMNAKISDFGMARIFGVDQSRETTRRPVGTLGYMPPEYAFYGQVSVKLDVFSFGVIVLEVISGKKRSSFYQSESADTILSYAWKLWRDGTPLELADQTLEGSYSRNEITRWIHISLLCVQEDPNARPSMKNVVLMLSSSSVTLPVPKKPAFLVHSRSCSDATNEAGFDQSKSRPGSVNEASTTEPYPR